MRECGHTARNLPALTPEGPEDLGKSSDVGHYGHFTRGVIGAKSHWVMSMAS